MKQIPRIILAWSQIQREKKIAVYRLCCPATLTVKYTFYSKKVAGFCPASYSSVKAGLPLWRDYSHCQNIYKKEIFSICTSLKFINIQTFILYTCTHVYVYNKLNQSFQSEQIHARKIKGHISVCYNYYQYKILLINYLFP